MADNELSQAILEMERGNKVKARELLASILRQDPKNADAWRWMAIALDDADKKRQCWQRVLSLLPGDEQAIKALAGLEVTRQTPVTPPQTPKGITREQPKSKRRGNSAYWMRLLVVGGVPLVLFGLCIVLAFVGALSRPNGQGNQSITPTDLPVQQIDPRVMYFCNYERCHDSDNYGHEIQEPSPLGIWKIPPQVYTEMSEDERAKYETPLLIRTPRNGEPVTVIGIWTQWEEYGPFGSWYQLDDGNWTRVWQLTEEICSPDNIDEYSYINCAEDEY